MKMDITHIEREGGLESTNAYDQLILSQDNNSEQQVVLHVFIHNR
ncbi:hypothetical protein [Paenibacillus terricola]|nr:hypothetical protein [Paenibacillus terricola]